MTSDANRKKHHTTRELLAGGGILLVSLPFVATALLLAALAVFISVVVLLGGESDQSSGYLFMLLVYGAALMALTYFSWRVLRRSTLLINRLRGIRQEQRRTAALTERDSARLTADELAAASRLTNTENTEFSRSEFADDHEQRQTRR